MSFTVTKSQAFAAARDLRSPVVGTGGSSLGTAMAMGCLLVGSSGGSVATTNKVTVDWSISCNEGIDAPAHDVDVVSVPKTSHCQRRDQACCTRNKMFFKIDTRTAYLVQRRDQACCTRSTIYSKINTKRFESTPACWW